MTFAGRALAVLAVLVGMYVVLPFVVDMALRTAPAVILLCLIGAILGAMVKQFLN